MLIVNTLSGTTIADMTTKPDCHRHVREPADLSRQGRDGCNNKVGNVHAEILSPFPSVNHRIRSAGLIDKKGGGKKRRDRAGGQG